MSYCCVNPRRPRPAWQKRTSYATSPTGQTPQSVALSPVSLLGLLTPAVEVDVALSSTALADELSPKNNSEWHVAYQSSWFQSSWGRSAVSHVACLRMLVLGYNRSSLMGSACFWQMLSTTRLCRGVRCSHLVFGAQITFEKLRKL